MIIVYDNKLFIIEAKSGSLTGPAKRGGIKRLESDLKDILDHGFNQAKRTHEFVVSHKTAIFRNKKGEKVLQINYDPNIVETFLINVTFEPLMNIGAMLDNLKTVGILGDYKNIWSVNLSDLEIILKNVVHPSIFIHFLEKRIVAMKENVFSAFDELSYFCYYMRKGNFNIPIVNNKKPNLIPLVEWTEEFDKHYVEGGKKPKLEIPLMIIKIIEELEAAKIMGYTKITSVLLDFNIKEKDYIVENIIKFISKVKKDKNSHDFTLFNKDLKIGFTFISCNNDINLERTLVNYCYIKKYQTKGIKWIGIGNNIKNEDKLIDKFVYIEGELKSDKDLDNILKENKEIFNKKIDFY